MDVTTDLRSPSCGSKMQESLPWNRQGPKGEPGAAGQAAHVAVRKGGATVANGAAASATAQCQPGEVATGGGAQIGNGGAGGTGGLGGNGGNVDAGNSGFANSGFGAAYLTGSVPNIAQGPATGWIGTVTNLSGSDQSLTVWALCAS
jgi:hypothetical protein